jgi:hypothetical protein
LPGRIRESGWPKRRLGWVIDEDLTLQGQYEVSKSQGQLSSETDINNVNSLKGLDNRYGFRRSMLDTVLLNAVNDEERKKVGRR